MTTDAAPAPRRAAMQPARLLVIGKYPPIQGGVSTQTYWFCRALAQLGHEVHVVTNAGAVEYNFRHLLRSSDKDQLQGPCGPGSVHVHDTSLAPVGSYIPWSAPHATQLFGRAADVVQKHAVDAVLGWYFEPYGVVAAQIANEYDLPLILRHAGSDLGRLARNPDLAATYSWMATHTSRIFTGSRTAEPFAILRSLGFREEHTVTLRAGSLPAVYTDRARQLDVEELCRDARDWYDEVIPHRRLRAAAKGALGSGRQPEAPTIGMYGKVGFAKGTYDLIAALDELARSGVPFTFLVLAAGWPQELPRFFAALASRPALRERSCVLPPMPPWRIPSFLAQLDVACFLERDFAIPFHYSSVPREILAAGSCLVCSDEMAEKLPFAANLVSDKNCAVIDDPRRTSELARRLGRLLTNPMERSTIARHGKYLSEFWESELATSSGFAGQIDDELSRFRLS